jgi:hypothetical protein
LKSTRYKKILGLAVGERSLFAAEVSAGARPQIRKLAELVYPPGISPQQPRELGQVLATFLRDQGVSAGAAIVGIPVKWLLVKCKEVPPVDGTTLSDMLRLQAESEFSSELKDLVFEYVQGPVGAGGKSVLLLATQRKHLDWVSELCEAAKLKTVGVIPAALALGQSTVGVASEKETMVLAVGQGGSELTTQSGGQSSSIKHLRACEPRAPFVSELRRAVSTMPASAAGRELVMWDGTDLDAHALSEQLGLSVRRGDLPSLGVDASLAGSNGQGHKFASAVAVALWGLAGRSDVDFLHSRLAPPKERRVPRWAVLAAAAAIITIGGGIYAYHDLQVQQTEAEKLQARLDGMKSEITAALGFVSKVSVAQAWHAGQPQYLACLRDLTDAIPEDGQTYASSLSLAEVTHPSSGSSSPSSAAAVAKETESRKLIGHLDGKTSDQQRAQWLSILDLLKSNPAFSDVTLGSTSNLTREREVSFSVNFTYDPAKARR